MSTLNLPPFLINTNLGVITVELFPEKAPLTVTNFLRYAKERFYHATLIHRAVDGFVVQGGGFSPGMIRKYTRAPIINEADNGLRHEAGTLAMARKPDDPASATSQWFINTVDNHFLNHRDTSTEGFGYCVFGRVVDGLQIIHDIEKRPTSSDGDFENVPVDDIVIESIKPLKASRS